MTTTVSVHAHVPSFKEVHVSITDQGAPVEHQVLQDGQSVNVYAYDGREISVKEVVK